MTALSFAEVQKQNKNDPEKRETAVKLGGGECCILNVVLAHLNKLF